jgi:site-specific DNA-cytosine methylase
LLAKPGTRHNASDETLIAFGWQNSAQQGDSCGNVSPSLDKSKTPAVFDGAQITSAANRSRVTPGAASPTLSKGSAMHAIASGARRLTPTECERLQGFPDHYTDVPYRGKPAADGPRYKAIGNSMAVPVMRWIFERIAMVDAA